MGMSDETWCLVKSCISYLALLPSLRTSINIPRVHFIHAYDAFEKLL